MDCPKCSERFESAPSIDDRQEWVREEYFCDVCNMSFTRLITYKTQSSMVESDEWEQKEFEIKCTFHAWGESKDDAWNSFVEELDGFNIKELQDLNVDSIEEV